MNLHNTFQTWALEGGLPCIGIVGVLLWKYFSILRRRIKQSKNDFEKSYYKLFVIASSLLTLGGLVPSNTSNTVFFICLGIVYALDDEYRNNKIHTLLEIGR
jgi:hypothetical protein